MGGGAGAQQWAHHSPQAGGPGRRGGGQNLWDANALGTVSEKFIDLLIIIIIR